MQSYVLLPKAVKEQHILTQLAQYQHRQNKQIGDYRFSGIDQHRRHQQRCRNESQVNRLHEYGQIRQDHGH